MATDKNKPGAKAGSIEEPQPVRAELFSYRLQYTPMPIVRARPKLWPVDSVRGQLLQTGRFQGLNTNSVLRRTRDLVAREDAKCVITFNASIIIPSGYLPAMVSFAAFSKSNHQPSITRKLLPTKYSYRATDSRPGRPNLSHNRKRSPSGACKGIL